MTLLVGTDLDRTLIYSRAALDAFGDGGRPLLPVERYRGADASWMTAAAAAQYADLAVAGACVVPVTTRTVDQWDRIALPGPPAQYVIAANGGALLVDGSRDGRWDDVVAAALSSVAPIAEVTAGLRTSLVPEWTLAFRQVEDLFCYAVVDRDAIPEDFLASQAHWAAQHGWRVSLQGRKLYWLPEPLSKAAAFAEVAARVGATVTLAAGDSLLDADLLLAADAGMVARHGELVASGWTAPLVQYTAAVGVLAGEEIVRWFSVRAGSR